MALKKRKAKKKVGKKSTYKSKSAPSRGKSYSAKGKGRSTTAARKRVRAGAKSMVKKGTVSRPGARPVAPSRPGSKVPAKKKP